MKIINRDEFLKSDIGSVFAKYDPCVFDCLCVLKDIRDDDFLYIPLIEIDASSSDEEMDVLDACERGEGTAKIRHDGFRDGLHDSKQLFAVFDNEDVSKMIELLKLGVF